MSTHPTLAELTPEEARLTDGGNIGLTILVIVVSAMISYYTS